MGDAIQKDGGITQNTNHRAVVMQSRLIGMYSELGYKQAELDLMVDGNHSMKPFLYDDDTIKIHFQQATGDQMSVP